MSTIIKKDVILYASISEIIDYQSETRPDEIAYRFLLNENSEETLTCNELLFRVSRTANFLSNHAVKGDRIILALKPGLDFIIGFFACVRIGAIAVPIFPPANMMMAKRFLHVINDAKPIMVLCDSDTSKLMRKGKMANDFLPGSLKRFVGVNEVLSSLFDKLKEEKIPVLSIEQANSCGLEKRNSCNSSPEDTVFLQYTSGSTGNPRGVELSHKNLLHNMGIIQRVLHHNPDSHMFSWLPPYHDMGLIAGILEPLFAGIPSTLISTIDFIEKPQRWVTNISKYRCTTTGAPNFAFSLCAKKTPDSLVNELDLSCLEVAANGAEPISKYVIENFYKKFKPANLREGVIFPCYGLAEATVMVSAKPYLTPEKFVSISKSKFSKHIIELTDNPNDMHNVLSSGVPQMEVVIVTPEQRTPSKPNEIGEIWIKGDSVAKGYYGNCEATKETFDNSLKIDGSEKNKYLRTGDLGFIYEGELFVCGRLKNLIIINGQNYYPHDIENAIALVHPDIRSGCIIAFSQARNDSTESLTVVVEIKSKTPQSQYAEMTEIILKTITEEFQIVPQDIFLVKEKSVPKTTSGKLQRIRCAELINKNELPILYHYHHEEELNQTDSVNMVPEVTSLNWLQLLHDIPPNERESLLCTLIRRCVINELNISEDSLDIDTGFFTLGFNSLKIIELKSLIQNSLGNSIQLDTTLVFNYPTIRELSKYLLLELKLIPENTTEKTVKPAARPLTNKEDIAIIGMDGIFPGAKTLEEFWTIIDKGLDALSDYPITRWDLSSTPEDHQAVIDNLTTTRAGIISGIDQFDPLFFSILPKAAEYMDPQHRLLLITSWRALEHAGINPSELKGSNTGVFIGISSHDYESRLIKILDEEQINKYIALGNSPSAATGRLSHFYGLQGPNMAIDTACSSSLVAIHEACQHLLHHECDLAIAGGVNALLTSHLFTNFSKAGMLSKNGQCNTFDSKADDYVRGEGCGIILLKRISDALRDNDTILATIKASGLNQDGASSGLTVPNGNAQVELLKKVLQKATLTPSQIDYIECHGTGTPLGDPIEANAVNNVYGNEERDTPLYLGSVKTNIGHLEAAAGIASIIKIVMALQHRRIPKHIHFNTLNPNIKLSQSIQIPQSSTDWLKRDNPRLAAVSGFGFSGTNAHLILAESPELTQRKEESIGMHQYLFILSAKTTVSLNNLIEAYIQYLQETEEDLGNICYTLSVGRQHFMYRLAIIAESKTELINRLLHKDYNIVSENNHNNTAIESTNIYEVHQAYSTGNLINWREFYKPFNSRVRKVVLPHYCFNRGSYWLVSQ